MIPVDPVNLRPQQFVADTLRRLTPTGATVVDVGCGPALYRDAVDGRYVGVDVTDEPYRDGIPREVDIVAPAHAMPLADGFADLLFTLSAFYQMGDAQTLLAEFRRVLRPGGRLVIFDYNRRTRRRLSVGEHADAPYPAWTQWRLRREVRRGGYTGVRLLAPVGYEARGPDRFIRLIREELRGQWAIVTAVK